jgi:hypothetical protein
MIRRLLGVNMVISEQCATSLEMITALSPKWWNLSAKLHSITSLR